MTWGTPAEIENRRRIRLAMAAYAYEILNDSIMLDHEFDDECRRVDLTIDTAYPHWDDWWRENFDPSTGLWIHQHPDHAGLHRLIEQRRGLMALPAVKQQLSDPILWFALAV